MSDHRNLDAAIAGNFKRKVRQNFEPFKQCKFNCDIAIKKLGMLIEIEKGQLPRIELDILKLECPNTPVKYLRRLKKMIGGFDMNIAVIGYEDPREPS